MFIALTMFIVTSITFFISFWIPGDPGSLWVGDRPTEEQLEIAYEELRVNEPLYIQYVTYLQRVSKLDLGLSLRTKQPILNEIKARFISTFELVTLSLILAIIIGFPIGLIIAINRESWFDYTVRASSYLSLSIPIFWLGMMLQLFFFGYLDILPLQGRSSIPMSNIQEYATQGANIHLMGAIIKGDWLALQDLLRHMLLPSITLALTIIGLIIRTGRSAMIKTIDENHFSTFLSFGYKKHEVIWSLAYKNTLIPLSTVTGLSYGLLMGGTFLLESVFDWPGIGQFVTLSILTNDFPAVIGVTLFYTFQYTFINLIVDMLYLCIDPRINNPNHD